ncbi:MAG TPA: Smr/MutS family protein [Methylovirgula sp.]|nr:Smr/MutS family protein [Methylovirgula sp.]
MTESDRHLRPLSEEEVALWLEVTRGVARRPGATLPDFGAPKPAKPSPHQSKEVAKPAPTPPATRLPRLAPLEHRERRKLERGSRVDAAIDLHGLRQQEAHHALHAFLGQAQRGGAKIVLVVTGKGSRPAEGFETGILRRSVPLWLKAPEWRSLVVGFEEASRTHGGAGALYVRIRRLERR